MQKNYKPIWKINYFPLPIFPFLLTIFGTWNMLKGGALAAIILVVFLSEVQNNMFSKQWFLARPGDHLVFLLLLDYILNITHK